MKVYLSATQKDLLEYRAAVHAVARRLEIEDVAMEAYGADVRPPLDRCLADVRRCDLYIGLFAWRYGFRPPGQESSITELEYREALAAGKPCLVFLLAEDPLAGRPGRPGADGERILELRRELKERHLCDFFSSVDDLTAKVIAALTDVLSGRSPGPWARRPGTHLPGGVRAPTTELALITSRPGRRRLTPPHHRLPHRRTAEIVRRAPSTRGSPPGDATGLVATGRDHLGRRHQGYPAWWTRKSSNDSGGVRGQGRALAVRRGLRPRPADDRPARRPRLRKVGRRPYLALVLAGACADPGWRR